MKKLLDPKENINNFILIASYQTPIIKYMISSSDKFQKDELYDFNKNKDNLFDMLPINNEKIFESLIKFFLSKNTFFKEKFTKSTEELKNYKIDKEIKRFFIK